MLDQKFFDTYRDVLQDNGKIIKNSLEIEYICHGEKDKEQLQINLPTYVTGNRWPGLVDFRPGEKPSSRFFIKDFNGHEKVATWLKENIEEVFRQKETFAKV